MSFFKRHLLFSILLSAVVLATFALGWFLYTSWSDAKAARAEAEQKQMELQRFLSLPVYPNRENAERVTKELADAKVALESMYKLLQSTSQNQGVFPAPPASRTEAYFSLTRFVEDFRGRAEQAGVAIATEERFGFSQFANQGPDLPTIPTVFRQRYLAEVILNTLLEARPTALQSFQREAVAVPAPVDPNNPVPAAPVVVSGGPDTFGIAPEISARREGFINTIAFRVQFTGFTNSLRAFLNNLASAPFPIVVRSVEVAPTGGDAQRNAPQEAPRRPATPFGGSPFGGQPGDPPLFVEPPVEERPIQIISQNVSSFVVTLEYVELVPEATPAAPNP